ncbi:MAG: putative DNA modification/repair radical SAM protein [Clostridiales bacterium]|nr:putative DNA modification/repair radical SAM protein [Clostridiales bacterium]
MIDEGRLKILTDGAKYDVSCSSSGSRRKNEKDGLGNASFGGICHSFAQDGRCISLLKILMSNDCVFDCRYCPNRRSADVQRATVTPEEVCELTMDFYRRNYIEGLFLSSAVYKNPDYAMELLLKTVFLLRTKYKFNGYIHLKGIPHADKRLIEQSAKLVDRMSYNVELPKEESLKLLAPQKTKESILGPMNLLANGKKEFALERKNRTGITARKGTEKYLPAGQTTQMIVGATPETDGQILRLSQAMYRKFDLKRVYYSSYLPVVSDPILPNETVGLLREHRLYQADWLMRFYGFSSEEISPLDENLPMEYDPKCAWALRNMQFFPIEVNTASVEELLRVPGIGAKGAYKIISARKSCALSFEHLKKMRIVLKRAKHFITASGKFYGEKKQENVKFHLMLAERQENAKQLDFFTLLPSQAEEKNQILLSATQRDKEFLLNSSPQIASSVLSGQL